MMPYLVGLGGVLIGAAIMVALQDAYNQDDHDDENDTFPPGGYYG